MNVSKTVISIQEYGKVNIKLKTIIEQKGMTRGALAKLTNTRFEVIDKWCRNNVEKLDLDVLARICYALECLPCDIIEYSEPQEM